MSFSGILMGAGFLVYIAAGLVSLGCLLGSCGGLTRGGVPGFLMMLGLSVVVGWIGQIGGGLLLAAGEALGNREEARLPRSE